MDKIVGWLIPGLGVFEPLRLGVEAYPQVGEAERFIRPNRVIEPSALG